MKRYVVKRKDGKYRGADRYRWVDDLAKAKVFKQREYGYSGYSDESGHEVYRWVEVELREKPSEPTEAEVIARAAISLDDRYTHTALSLLGGKLRYIPD